VPTRSQSTSPEDRACIRFYGDDGSTSLADLATDLGQYESDLTVGAGNDCVYEASPATRFNLTIPRTIAMVLSVAHSTNSTLWNHGSGSSRDRLRVEAGNYEYAPAGSTAVITAPVPAGTSQIVSVRSEPNPGSMGDHDAVRSTLEIYDVTNSVLTRYTATHEARSLPTAEFAFLAVASDGTNSYIDAGGECTTLRFSSRAVAFSEIAQDWIANLSNVTSDAKLERQGLPLTEESGVGEQAEFHGAAAQLAASQLRHVQWRTMGPALNWCFINNSAIDDTDHSDASHREKIMLAPGGDTGTGFRLRLGWFGVAPVHPFCNALWVEVLARCWNVTDADLRTFGLRIYSFNKLPIIGQQLQGNPGEEQDPFDYRYGEATFTADDSAPGVYRIQAVVPVAVGESGIARGKTYIGLAYAMDLLDEGAETFQIAAYSMHTVQMFDTTVGLPPGGGPAGESG
jgi:hypothetical protein